MRKKVYSIDEIREIIAPVMQKHGVERVYLFGSYARGEADESSDVDLCIDASRLRGMFALGSLYADLEDVLGKPLDLLTFNSMKYNQDEHFKNTVQKEQVLIYDVA